MNVLFIHQNFPAQFKHLVRRFAGDPGNKVVAICQSHAPVLHDEACPNLITKVYKPTRTPTKNIHHYLYHTEEAVLNGQAVARVLQELKRSRYKPDVCFAHPGWGEALFFKEVFADVPLIIHCEFFYHARGADMGFDPAFPAKLNDHLNIRTKNIVNLLSLDACDAGVSPTRWQRGLFPNEYQPKITMIHEGIDTAEVVPDPAATLTLPDGAVLDKSMEIVTYTARNLEPYRGFHVFMLAVEAICRRRPQCRVLITGGDDVSYGRRLPNQQIYREKMLSEVSIDPERVYFFGKVPYSTHLKMLQISSAHIYLTYPFVLSWSVLEAMASACLVIGSDTPPVKEVIEHEKTGLLVDFFAAEQIADRVDEVLEHPDRMRRICERARQYIVDNFDLRQSVEQYDQLCRRVIDHGACNKV